jgi:Putative DNA-binding domain
VPPLRDLQRGVRDALILGDTSELESVITGGRDSRRRLAIHQRHYHASLVTALLDRFPATVWLVGSPFVTEAAREFVRSRPPSRPCIAEYGEEFPAFLAIRPGAAEISYLRQFAGLEWHVSRLALAVDLPALEMPDLTTIDTAAFGDATVVLQSGVHYFHADWAIDELISFYLSEDAPEHFSLQPGDLWLELRGARGELGINRLSHAEFAFRAALAVGESLTDAAVSALEIETGFDPGLALLTLVSDGLVVIINRHHRESHV